MKKMKLTKKSTEFGTYHENEYPVNDYSSDYDSVEEKHCTEEDNCKETSRKKEECYQNSCKEETEYRKTKR